MSTSLTSINSRHSKKVSKAYDDEKKKCYACTGTKISTDGDDCEEPNTIRRSDWYVSSPHRFNSSLLNSNRFSFTFI